MANQTVIDLITSDDDGIVMYREATETVNADGEVVSRKFHRASLTPGQSLSGVPSDVAAYAQKLWTPAVVSAFKAKKIV